MRIHGNPVITGEVFFALHCIACEVKQEWQWPVCSGGRVPEFTLGEMANGWQIFPEGAVCPAHHVKIVIDDKEIGG
jgi:hypothetical protein